jgi:glycosyltransferase involved in cell wall biosynthesis
MEAWVYGTRHKRLIDGDDHVSQASLEDLIALKPDMVIFHSIYLDIRSYRRIARALKREGIPYMVEPHGNLDARAMGKSTLKKRIANFFLVDPWIEDAQAVIYLCKEEERYSRRQTDPVEMVTNTFPTVVPILDQAPERHKPVRLMMLGRMDPFHKGLDLFFDTLKRLPEGADQELEVVLYGIGSKERLAWLNEEIDQIKNISVTFMGPVFGEEKAQAYREADIFCMFSRYEGLPLTLYEAAASGLPLIVTEGSNRTDWVEENKNGWILWDKDQDAWPDLLMEAVKAYQEDPKEYRNYALASARALPTWEDIAEMSEDVYRKQVKNHDE